MFQSNSSLYTTNLPLKKDGNSQQKTETPNSGS